jgi:thioredoxin 1
MKYLYFSAQWCQPCSTLSPIMAQVGQSVSVQKIDVDSQSALASQYNVRNVPTVILVNGSTEVKRFVGIQSKETYINAAR